MVWQGNKLTFNKVRITSQSFENFDFLARLCDSTYQFAPVVLIADDLPHFWAGAENIMGTRRRDDPSDLWERPALKCFPQRSRHL
jgi:hypothetical protein